MIELIDTFIRPLNEHDIRYIITGSLASMVYGEPRLTNDVDVVLDIKSTDIAKLIEAFPEADFYLPPVDVIETELLRGSRGHFNIISQHSMLKADIYLVGSDPIQLWGMVDARIIEIENQKITFAPPEYVIIRKLEFYREGNSEKHLRDIAAMLTESPSEINQETLQKHIAQLGLQPQWQSALALTHDRN
jgi:predicted nucleotidyltransferase